MGEIVLARVDDRLIHGQVMTSWLNYTGANRIIIIDNETAADPFMSMIVTSVAPANIKTEVFNVEEGSKKLKDIGDSDKIIVLAKTPSTYVELIEQGVEIPTMNIGGMGAKPGRKKLYKNISASEKEKNDLKKVVDKGIPVSIRIIAEDKAIDVKHLL